MLFIDGVVLPHCFASFFFLKAESLKKTASKVNKSFNIYINFFVKFRFVKRDGNLIFCRAK